MPLPKTSYEYQKYEGTENSIIAIAVKSEKLSTGEDTTDIKKSFYLVGICDECLKDYSSGECYVEFMHPLYEGVWVYCQS